MAKIFRVYVLPAIFILIPLLSLFFLRSVPSVQLWDGYVVLYVDSDSQEETVSKVLLDNGCENVISSDNQFVPLNVNVQSPEFSLAFSGLEDSSYFYRRSDYFFDKSKNHRLYYIPEEFAGQGRKACDLLNSEYGIKAGMSFSASYPWIAVSACLLLAVLLIIYSEKKLLLASLELFPVLLSFSLPVYSVTAAVCLLNLAISLLVRFWKREYFFGFVRKNPISLIFPIVSLFIFILSGLRSTFLFITVLLGIYGVLCIYNIFEKLSDRRYFFIPKKIIPSSMFKFIGTKAFKPVIFCVGAIFIISIYAAVSSKSSGKGSSNEGLLIPSPASAKAELVNFDDYLKWKWNVQTFPYRNLNSNNSDENHVKFYTYEEVSGLVQEKENYLSFDEDFREKSIAEVKDYKFPALEKMLLSQKASMKAGYVAPGSQRITILTIILLLVAIGTPCGVYIYSIRQK